MRFVQEQLVTDTRVWEVIRETPKTLRLRSTRRGGTVKTEDNGSPFPVVWTEVEPDPNGREYTVRRRKDGTYRLKDGKPLRPAAEIKGIPVTRIDYSF